MNKFIELKEKEEVYNKLAMMPQSQCNCNACQRMCSRPCYGTPEDIEKLIEEGYGDRLCLDYHCGLNSESTIFLLSPALKDHEGGKAPFFPVSKSGCTFFIDGKCELHNSGLKPIGGKIASCKKDFDSENYHLDGGYGAYISETWNTQKGQDLVEKWCKERNIEMEIDAPSTVEMMQTLLHPYLDTAL